MEPRVPCVIPSGRFAGAVAEYEMFGGRRRVLTPESPGVFPVTLHGHYSPLCLRLTVPYHRPRRATKVYAVFMTADTSLALGYVEWDYRTRSYELHGRMLGVPCDWVRDLGEMLHRLTTLQRQVSYGTAA